MKSVLLLSALLLSSPALAQWKPSEKVETYAISGQSVEALY
ncbi:MAG: peptidase, partial [Mesorhizobium sp.]